MVLIIRLCLIIYTVNMIIILLAGVGELTMMVTIIKMTVILGLQLTNTTPQ